MKAKTYNTLSVVPLSLWGFALVSINPHNLKPLLTAGSKIGLLLSGIAILIIIGIYYIIPGRLYSIETGNKSKYPVICFILCCIVISLIIYKYF